MAAVTEADAMVDRKGVRSVVALGEFVLTSKLATTNPAAADADAAADAAVPVVGAETVSVVAGTIAANFDDRMVVGLSSHYHWQ